jgi:hypothetical protein
MTEKASRRSLWDKIVAWARPGFDWSPALEDGERIIARGVAHDRGTAYGANIGPLFLTNRRIAWRQGATSWPIRRSTLDIPLRKIRDAGKTSALGGILAGRRLQIRLKDGKTHRLSVRGLDEWVRLIRQTLREATAGEQNDV